jgi:C4-dicarboxylate-specific signal transduction histidine kinase
MKQSTEDVMRAKYLAFVGRVSASLSHEIKNTLAIISETSGLISDLLEYAPPPADWETYPRFKKLLTSIAEQVSRSGTIVTRLNRFAHSMDEPIVSLELNGLLQDINNLAQRFADLRKVRLETRLSNGALPIQTDPFRLQQVVFGFIDRGLQSAPQDSRMTLASGQAEGMAQITITDEGSSQAESIRRQVATPLPAFQETQGKNDLYLPVLGLIATQLGGSIDVQDLKPQGNRVTLTFPLETEQKR